MSEALTYENPKKPDAALKRWWLYATLLASGTGLLFVSGLWRLVWPAECIFALIGLLFGLLPAPARRVAQFAEWLASLSRRKQVWLVAILGVLLPCFFLLAAWKGHRALVPMMHDEQMYLLQARQLASGHVAMPALPMGEFFDTYYVFVKPVYASMYFPGTALAYLPSIWLDLPYCAWPVLIMSGLMIVSYLVAARIVGRFLALVAVFVTLAAGPMNWMPTATMSHPLGALFGMTVVYAWIRWREQPRIGWAVLLGAAAGWMAITRPLESTCYGLPVLIAIACATRRRNLGVTVRHATVAILCTLPFISLQLVENKTITGQWTKLPITLYDEMEFPGISSLLKGPPDLKSASTLPNKQAMMKAFITPMLKRQAMETPLQALWTRAVFILWSATASPAFIILLPLSLAMVRRNTPLAVLWGILITFTVAYGLFGGYFAQYSSQVMAIFAILIVAGARELWDRFPRFAGPILGSYSGAVVGITAVVLCNMPNNGLGNATGYDWSIMQFNYERLEQSVQKPALVMIRFGEHSSPFVEPVYNIATAWPDDAEVIRAHDFGPQRDLALFRYYAKFQPQRNVYLFDRDSGALKPLGPVAELVRQADAALGSRPPATKPAAATEPQ